MDRASTIFLIFIVMLACAAIGAFGFQKYYTPACPAASPQASQTSPQASQLSGQDQQELERLRLLKSNLVNSIVLFGEVTSISGNLINLSSGQESVPVIIGTSAKIYFVAASGANAGNATVAQFSDIKIGDGVQIEANLSAENQLVGFYVAIAKQ